MLKNSVMRTNQEIRQEASAMLKSNWSVAVLVALVFGVIASFTSCSFPLALFVYAPMMLGFVKMMLGYVRGTQRMEVEGIFSAFNSTYYWKSMGLYLLQGIYTFLWTLLFIIPGIVKYCSYFFAPYILADNPTMTAEESICRSMQIMEGHKMQLFLMLLGYTALAMLSSILLFIPMLWIMPYYQVALAKFYEEVKHSVA
jgi:uncharacterized membrane protein